MTITPINNNQSIYLTPIAQAIIQSETTINTHNSTPVQSFGTIQENQHLLPKTTIYNSHGVVTPNTPNSFIAYI